MERNRRAIREAARERLRSGDIADIGKDSPKKLRARLGKGTREPRFRHGLRGGSVEGVLPGNKKFIPGDVIPRPEDGGGSGTQGSPEGGGETDYVFEVSQKEFLDIIFEGLELPDFVKRRLTGEEAFEWHRAGLASEGPPNRRDLVRSVKNAKMRRRAFTAAKRRRIAELETRRGELEHAKGNARDDEERVGIERELTEIQKELEKLRRALRAIPFLDESDIVYRRFDKTPRPISRAVMFCIRDASASMDKRKTELSCLFMLLLHLFLTRNYNHVTIVYIWHTQYAKEVNWEEFFYSRETGGTIVSSALHLMKEIVKERFPLSDYNIYGCQASDGEDWAHDLSVAQQVLAEEILPLVQFYAYIEVSGRVSAEIPGGVLSGEENGHSDLWRHFSEIAEHFPNFVMAEIREQREVYPVLRELFEPAKHKERRTA